MQPIKPITPFGFAKAVTQPFQSSDGKKFAWRLLFWMAGAMSIIGFVTVPFLAKHYPTLLEYNWLNFQSITGEGPAPDPDMVLAIFPKIFFSYLIMMLGMWVVFAMGEAAMHRKLLLGQEHNKRPIAFGRDERRVMLAQFCVWGLWFLLYAIGLFVLILVGGLIGAAVPLLGGLLILIGALALLGFLIWMPVRIAPAAALSVWKDETIILKSKAVTQHRFWSLFGAYLVLGLGGYIAVYALMLIGLMIIGGTDQVVAAMMGVSEQNPRIIFEAMAERFKNPLVVLLAVLTLIAYMTVYCLWSLCMSGIAVYAVKWWQADHDAL